jgi:acyl-CoA dehydrogenase
MPDRSFLNWPFFDESHRTLARDLEAWCERELPNFDFDGELDATCRAFALKLGKAGWLRYAVPKRFGGAGSPSSDEKLDVRSICIIRETIARYSGLGEFIFAMQGLGSCPITQFGSEKLKTKYLPGVAQGNSIAAFAISEAAAGSDISAMTTTARRSGSGYIIDGEKTWISNGGIASQYVVFCRLPELGEKSFIALMVDADNPGLSISERIEIIAPHPLATLKFKGCHVGEDAVVGKPGDGIRIAHSTLDVFRPTVGAAALGLARRALDESITHCGQRRLFGQKLSDFQITQAKLADMATSIDASALLVYRAAWTRDRGAERITREAAMAKLFSTEAAQRIIDDAVQLFGSRGVVSGETMERLYREVRALRIYEGASEVQKLIIAAQILRPEKQTGAQQGQS